MIYDIERPDPSFVLQTMNIEINDKRIAKFILDRFMKEDIRSALKTILPKNWLRELKK